MLERLDNHKAATADYHRALELDPDLLPVRLRVAEMLLEDKQAPEALPHLERLYRQAPDHPQVQARLGMCRFLQGRAEEARRLMEAAVVHLPDDPALLVDLAKLDLQEGRAAEAERRLRTVLAADPSDTEALYVLASALQFQGRTEEAAAALADYEQKRVLVERTNELLKDVADSPTARPTTTRRSAICSSRSAGSRSGCTGWSRPWSGTRPTRRPTAPWPTHYERKGDAAQAARPPPPARRRSRRRQSDRPAPSKHLTDFPTHRRDDHHDAGCRGGAAWPPLAGRRAACGWRLRRASGKPAPPQSSPPHDPDLTGPDLFEDVTAASGIDFTYRNGEEASRRTWPSWSRSAAGVALIDYDGDGLLDVFLPGGGHFDGPDKKQILGPPVPAVPQPGRLEVRGRDRGGRAGQAGRRAAVVLHPRRRRRPTTTATAGPTCSSPAGAGSPCSATSRDGKGGRRFADVTPRPGWTRASPGRPAPPGPTSTATASPTCTSASTSTGRSPTTPTAPTTARRRDVCPPKKFNALPHKLYRNNGDGTFTDVSDEAGLQPGGEHGEQGAGRARRGREPRRQAGRLRRQRHGRQLPVPQPADAGEDPVRGAGACWPGSPWTTAAAPNGSMGVDAGDSDGDRPAGAVGDQLRERAARPVPQPVDRDRVVVPVRTPRRPASPPSARSSSAGAPAFLDFDHDGWEDLFIANGHAIRYPTGASRRQKPVLLRNRGRASSRTSPPRGGAVLPASRTWAAAWPLGDLDNDGRVDLVVSHLNEPVAVLRNVAPRRTATGSGSSWPARTTPTWSAPGSCWRPAAGSRRGSPRAAAATPRRRTGGSCSAWGRPTKVDKLTVVWPDGTQQEWTGLATDRYHVLTQGEKDPARPAQSSSLSSGGGPQLPRLRVAFDRVQVRPGAGLHVRTRPP